MQLLRHSLLIVSFLALAAGVAWSQSLAEVAAREKQRQERERKKAGGAAKVITDDDLRGRRAGTSSNLAPSGSVTPSPSPTASPAAEKKAAEQVRAEQEKAWRDRRQEAQEEVTRLAGVVETLQAVINDNTVNLYGAGRRSTLAQMEEAQRSLAAARQKVDDLQEEGRRSGFR